MTEKFPQFGTEGQDTDHYEVTNNFPIQEDLLQKIDVLGKPFFKSIEGVDATLLSVMDTEYEGALAKAMDDLRSEEESLPVADFRVKEDASYENVNYDESVREFIGKAVSPEDLAELMDGINELSDEEKESLVSFSGDFFDSALLGASNDPGSHEARISTVATSAVFASPDELAKEENTQEQSAQNVPSTPFNPKYEKIKRVLTATLATIATSLALAQPALAGDRHNHGRQQFEQQAKTAVFNAIFTGIQGELAKKGVHISGGVPVPMPGAQYPIYGGVGGYEMGGGMSVEQAKAIQRIKSYETQLRSNHVKTIEAQNDVDKWCGLSMDNPRDTRWAQSCAKAVAKRDALVNERARVINEIGRLQQELRYTR